MSIKTVYLSPQWQELLSANDLTTFDQWWALQLKSVDEGNEGRGQNGWSRVAIHTLSTPDGDKRRVIVKRQSNYRSRTMMHPVTGIATFEKEYAFIRRYAAMGIPATQAIYCATRRINGELQAILITEFLDGYSSLADILQKMERGWQPDRQQRDTTIHQVATLIKTLHGNGMEHRCLFPKHIFIPLNSDGNACLIDLEKTRWKPWDSQRLVRDLAAFARRTTIMEKRDIVLFYRTYLGTKKLDNKAKELINAVTARLKKKHRLESPHT